MIQFGKPKRTFTKSTDQFRRHETSARDYLSPAPPGAGSDSRRSGTPSRFDSSFYRGHDALGYISTDVQSLRSQATYSSGLPMFTATGAFPRGSGGKRAPTSYASSIISQDAGPSTDTSSVVGSTTGASSVNLAYSQSDRLTRRGSFGSASEVESLATYDYSQDDLNDMDDVKSQYAGTQSGVTVF